MAHGKLDALLDRAAISDLIHLYATGVDQRDWPRYRRCFTDPFEVDLSSWNGAPARSMPADVWVEGVRAGLSGFDSTQHISANHLIELDGDEARCTSYMQASHCLDGDRAVLGGYYDSDLRRTAEGWKIRRSRLTITWSRATRISSPKRPGG